MKLIVDKIEDPFLMEVKNENGNSINIDASESAGGSSKGFRPMELVAAGLAGCSSIDIISVLRKKRKTIHILHVDVYAKRVDEIPAVFESIHLTFHLKTDASSLDIEQALKLTFEKYCSVSRMLEKTVEITYSYLILT